ncbi:hypothetical protein BU14_0738s0005 [Porphyra umbilicalis]|uniref:Uncharacterized protein n=1 Tax=Porphyra umbilicalis TaxID=2786 RepID=A0A1X6NPP5_PORUM|nr:hypothetical protein BU14_0738s0005 [Porphyra umbilicalis]|eukprot:OSX70500.1 hypothetical protein BU14_0738s0005 [Porphyra umbilicalis]
MRRGGGRGGDGGRPRPSPPPGQRRRGRPRDAVDALGGRHRERPVVAHGATGRLDRPPQNARRVEGVAARQPRAGGRRGGSVVAPVSGDPPPLKANDAQVVRRVGGARLQIRVEGAGLGAAGRPAAGFPLPVAVTTVAAVVVAVGGGEAGEHRPHPPAHDRGWGGEPQPAGGGVGRGRRGGGGRPNGGGHDHPPPPLGRPHEQRVEGDKGAERRKGVDEGTKL